MSSDDTPTSTQILETLKRWQEERRPEDAAFLADELPNVLRDVARVKAAFLTLRERVRKLDDEMETYRQIRLLNELSTDDDTPAH